MTPQPHDIINTMFMVLLLAVFVYAVTWAVPLVVNGAIKVVQAAIGG